MWTSNLLNFTSFQDIGHLSFLEAASKLGDFIIVGVHTDGVSISDELIVL